jgi:hypothetical protein
MDPKLQLVLDTPIFSKRALTTAKPLRFFDNPGLSANDNIDSANQIDMNSDFALHRIECNVMKTDGSALVTADVALLAKLQKETWINFLKNTTDKAWSSSISSLMAAPMAVAAAGAMAYDPFHIVRGGTTLNVPLIIQGGQNINVTLNWETASDFTTLTMELVLWGIIDRGKTVR